MPEAAVRPADLLAQAEATRLADNPRFLHILKQLNHDESRLSPTQEWHLRYLNAWQSAFAGKLAKATPVLHDIIDHSNNPSLTARASATLINVLDRNNHYTQAYTLAGTLIASLAKVTDATARRSALLEIVQMLGAAGQYDQALQYSQQLLSEHVSGESQCPTYAIMVNVLFSAERLSSTSPELRKAIDMCVADKKLVYANTLRLDWAYLLTHEGHANQAIALLQRIAPSIHRANFQPHVASVNVTLAQAYLSQQNDADAKKFALATLTMSKGFQWASQAAYKVLYEVEKTAGNDAAALSWFENYLALDEAASNDTKSRALAYQMVKQEVVAKKLRLEALSKQNKILQLHQSLTAKSVEASRLYIALLLLVIVFIIAGMYRLRRSQLRFRNMARHDGLTGAFNRQHFLNQAQQALDRLHTANVCACLVLLDLDHFKDVNDTYGHAAGDDVLTRAVDICRAELRTSDIFGRLGGEEFGILMPACSRDQGVEITHRIRRTLAATSTRLTPGTVVRVSASFGLACTSNSGFALPQLLSVADAALYRAKDAGRNQLVVGNDDAASAGAADAAPA